MAKKQTFGDKVRKQRDAGKQMAKIVAAEKKSNGEYRFRQKMVNVNDVKDELNAAKQAL